eukprot:407919-Rhodomonas_salina.1
MMVVVVYPSLYSHLGMVVPTPVLAFSSVEGCETVTVTPSSCTVTASSPPVSNGRHTLCQYRALRRQIARYARSVPEIA